MTKNQLLPADLDSKIYEVVEAADRGVKGRDICRDIYSRLSDANALQPSDVARSIWRLHNRGKVTVRAGRGVELANDGQRIR